MRLDEDKIGLIVEKVVERLSSPSSASRRRSTANAPYSASYRYRSAGNGGIFDTVDQATAAAKKAQQELRDCTLKNREAGIAAMRRMTLDHLQEISERAVSETGLGRVDDKLVKNRLIVEKTPGTEILKPSAYSGDHGLMLEERSPYGVIAAITPTTNPTETILCNTIGMIAGGNSVVFNVHPAAKELSADYIRLLNEAMVSTGLPENLITAVANPTIQSANEVMTHPDTRLVVVTGGGAVVRAAMTSGKRAIAAGPGNPPVLVDETANLKQAGEGIVRGAGLDCNIVCIAEKEIIAVDDIADRLKREMKEFGGVEIKGRDLSRLEKLLVTSEGKMNRAFIGKRPSFILNEIGVRVPEDTRIVFAEVPDERHPFVQLEMLSPVIPLVRVPDVQDGIAMAKRVEHGFRHTAVMYSMNIQALHDMAYAMDCSIFVKNAPSFAGLGLGGEGYTSFTIASPTGEGLTTAVNFTRERRCTLKDHFRIV